jgi:hypothetical protein
MNEEGPPVDIIKQTMQEQLDRIRAALSDRRLARVAARTGLHENTIRAIVNKKNEFPSLTTIEKLTDYLFGAGADADDKK